MSPDSQSGAPGRGAGGRGDDAPGPGPGGSGAAMAGGPREGLPPALGDGGGDGGPGAAAASAPAALGDWGCPVCLEGPVCKPVITPCGHLFCFWCGHKSMSFIGASACPLCRFEYTKFPRLCGALHEFLGRAFPGEYRARLAALDEDEAEMQHQSPQPAAGAAPAATDAELFRCVRCAGLLFEPVALNCGHLACLACCVGDALAGGGPLPARVDCPECGEPSDLPRPCLQLDGFLKGRFAAEYAASGRESQLDALAALAAEAGAGAGGREPAAEGEAGAAGAGRPSLLDPDHYTHLGVGCDGCGVYPIVGRRFKCLQCPETIGYDLCRACMDRDRGAQGRFNQNHTKDHEMEEVLPQPTLLHVLADRNHESIQSMANLMDVVIVHTEEEAAGELPEDPNAQARAALAGLDLTDPEDPNAQAGAALAGLHLTGEVPDPEEMDDGMELDPVCSICRARHNADGNHEDLEWCTACCKPFHLTCLGLPEQCPAAAQPFTCPECSERGP